MADITPFAVGLLAFGAVSCVAYAIGQYYLRNSHLYSRLPAVQGVAGDPSSAGRSFAALVARHFDEKRFGVDESTRGRLRLNLVRAGYFRKDSINFYVFWSLAAVVLMPAAAYILLLLFAPHSTFLITLIVILCAMGLGVIGPQAFVARKQRLLSAEYRIVFPDFLDLLTVCVDAGLSLEGALSRITPEIGRRNHHFGVNLAVMGAEMRAGRTFVEALGTLAERLMISEARSLVAVLRQSAELGSDVADALRVFSDEMRSKRMLRAEEQANKLSVKMLLPLALFIFPVVLMVIVLPTAIRIIEMFR
jgi:tight adherence protein C